MHILQIILKLASVCLIGLTVAFTFFAFFRLKKQETDIRELNIVMAKTLALVMGAHIQRSFETLNEMKETLRELIADERFEEANDLRKTIAKMEHCSMRELERFKENFGEDCVDVEVTSIRRTTD